MPAQDLNSLAGARYISLETYRRNGQAVRTPVWFVEDGGRLLFYSMATAGKVKRIRNNPAVALATSDARGRVRPDAVWLRGRASLLEPAEAERAHKLLVKKYGWQRRLLDVFWVLSGRKPRAALAIVLD
ncbi:MAG TPA: PPOX class F420-dependent oxidoreductase [Terriglobales bacterium]|nr:PPOX class F420-dependent oxidoreductase [Terriglobales bacterium]